MFFSYSKWNVATFIKLVIFTRFMRANFQCDIVCMQQYHPKLQNQSSILEYVFHGDDDVLNQMSS